MSSDVPWVSPSLCRPQFPSPQGVVRSFCTASGRGPRASLIPLCHLLAPQATRAVASKEAVWEVCLPPCLSKSPICPQASSLATISMAKICCGCQSKLLLLGRPARGRAKPGSRGEAAARTGSWAAVHLVNPKKRETGKPEVTNTWSRAPPEGATGLPSQSLNLL